MEYLTTEQVIEKIEQRRQKNPPKMVYEADYKRLEKKFEKVQERLEACVDALVLELKGLKEAMEYVEFENRTYRRRLTRQKKKIEDFEKRLATGEK
jgi:methyl coenzyme M reductase subunit C-like uncharacterized protein (methanogenesis marker protein 7)